MLAIVDHAGCREQPALLSAAALLAGGVRPQRREPARHLDQVLERNGGG